MTDSRGPIEAYLRQRVEMREGVVYTSGVIPTGEGSLAGCQEAPADPVSAEGPSPNSVGSAQQPAAEQVGRVRKAEQEAAAIPKWAVDAPEIPGPGSSVSLVELITAPNGEYESLDLPQLAERIAGCRDCSLCESRTNTVPGVGDPGANLMVVGEGPGQHEDQQGEPFVGRAGKLLDDILVSIGLDRPRVYICNVVKCRPPQNRNPQPEEVAACIPYLYRQIELVAPKVILAVGAVAACSLLGTKKSLGQMRNKVHEFRGIPLVVTYHPAALLRNPNWKRPTWDDVRIARRILDSRS